jgi:hypothetical protein
MKNCCAKIARGVFELDLGLNQITGQDLSGAKRLQCVALHNAAREP